MDLLCILRIVLSLILGAFVLWVLLTLSVFVVLPLLIVLAAVGGLFYWRYGKMFTSATEGEVGQALQEILEGQAGLVRFNREMKMGASNYHTNVNLSCTARTNIQAGETVCVESVDANTIFIKRIGE